MSLSKDARKLMNISILTNAHHPKNITETSLSKLSDRLIKI